MKYIITLILSLTMITVYGQQDQISFSPGNTGQTYLTCNAFIIDSGGQGGSGYSNNETFTITICPDTISTGDNTQFITVTFNLFQLDGTNTGTQQNPNVDAMTVYDGPDNSYPTLGSYNTDGLETVSISATNLNGSGCLTFQFYSNTVGTGQFSASATCTQPCVPPVADAFIVDGDTPDSIRVCVGEPVTFDATASTAATGFDIQEYAWNFVDGTIDNTTGAVITHSFDAPGHYPVQLTLTDDNPGVNCQNLNVTPLKVYVSNYPTYSNFPANTTICLGQEISLAGITDFGQYDSTWTGFPGSSIIDDGCLPDTLLGVSQSIPVTYTEFDPSAVISSVDDIMDICLNMEHSFMGDLVIQLSCPNGTTINLQTQGGGGTQIGVPDQADNVNCEDGTGIGEGWDYCWDADATETWTDWVDNNGFGGTLPEGTYASVDPLSDLIGCPLQGTWQITVIDNWAADDGTIFEFGVTFDPSFYPDIVEFTNTVGEDADSSFWDLTDPWIIDNTSNLNQITILPEQTGTFNYNYSVVNNFGCEFDSTVTITVIDGPEITAGPDLTVCDEPVTLQAGLAGAQGECSDDSGTYEYCYGNSEPLIVTYCPDNPGDGVTFMEFSIISGEVQDFWDSFVVYDGDDTSAPILAGPMDGDLSGMSFSATNATGCITFAIYPVGFGACEAGFLEPLQISVSCLGGANLVWSWSPAEGLSNPNVQNPTVLVDQATVYTVSAYPAGFPDCEITDQVIVSPDAASDPGLDTDTTMCYNSPLSTLTDYLNGNPANTGVWTDASGNTVPNEFNPTSYADNGGNFTFNYTVTNGACVGESTLNITILPATNNTCCQTNAQANVDAVACDLSYTLQAEPALGQGTWSGPPNVSFSDIHDPNAIVTAASPGGSITLTWTDNNGTLCSQSDEVTIQFSDPLELLVVTENAVCYNECTGKAIAIPDGGTAPNGSYVYDWLESGKPGLIPATRDSLCAGTHYVKVFDNFGCVDSTFYEIGQPEPQEIFVTQRPPLCAGSCDGRVTISSPGATSYSFDGGTNFASTNIGFLCEGEHVVVAKNEAGCEIDYPVNLVDPPKFVANFNVNPYPTTVRNTRITFQDISTPGPLASSLYTFGNDPVLAEGNSRISTFTFPNDTSGTYPVTLISTNVNGCSDTLVKDVVINDDLLLFIPNSFSPNEDGINDIWKPQGSTIDLTDYQLTVVDRWGRVVFATQEMSQGWNGSNMDDGYYVDAGVYNYLIKVTSKTTEDKYELTGFITVIR